jgi:hypothetical protein
MTKENRQKRYNFYLESGQEEKAKQLELQFPDEFKNKKPEKDKK